MSKRYCVVTPYYKEEREIIERCLRSVASQTVPVDHIMMADGHPQDWIDKEPVRHIKLDQSHGDCGNTPRGMGALMAVAENYDGICFLDADNWYDNDHVEACLAAASAKATPPDFVAAQRRFVRPDGSLMWLQPADQPHHPKIDTNCYFFLPRSYYVLGKWCTIPRALSQHGDELFYHFCRSQGLQFAVADHRTVNYTCLFEACYQLLNEPSPPNAKPVISWDVTNEWLAQLEPEALLLVQRGTGLHLRN